MRQQLVQPIGLKSGEALPRKRCCLVVVGVVVVAAAATVAAVAIESMQQASPMGAIAIRSIEGIAKRVPVDASLLVQPEMVPKSAHLVLVWH